jgi:ADP-heptose:LPS heptosyltransferase
MSGERDRERVLVARLDNLGDVLLSGPVVRAVASSAEVIYLCGPAGRAAVELLPGVGRVITFEAPWVGDDAPQLDVSAVERLVRTVARLHPDKALILTSFHQSPLPLALLLRIAGIGTLGATCEDFPGSLLDVRHPRLEGVHEVEQGLSLAAALGYQLPVGDDGALAVKRPGPFPMPRGERAYVVVHPGASVPARALPRTLAIDVVEALVEDGFDVVVTGSPAEVSLAERVAGEPSAGVRVAAGTLDLRALSAVIQGAHAVVCGNTGPAHLAAAVGTPVVSVFPPTVEASRWGPWCVPSVVLGDQGIACAGCRARRCPIQGQPCTGGVTAAEVVAAVRSLHREDRSRRGVSGGPGGPVLTAP